MRGCFEDNLTRLSDAFVVPITTNHAPDTSPSRNIDGKSKWRLNDVNFPPDTTLSVAARANPSASKRIDLKVGIETHWTG
jgi:hypothetical protein